MTGKYGITGGFSGRFYHVIDIAATKRRHEGGSLDLPLTWSWSYCGRGLAKMFDPTVNRLFGRMICSMCEKSLKRRPPFVEGKVTFVLGPRSKKTPAPARTPTEELKKSSLE